MLRVTIYHNGCEANYYELYSDDERSRLRKAIEDLWTPTYNSNCKFFLCDHISDGRAQPVIYYGVGDDIEDIPKEWMNKTYRFGAPGVNERTLKLVGDRIPIDMGQSTLEKIEVMFR